MLLYFVARLHDSMHANRFRNFCTLVGAGSVDINAIDSNGHTPLIAACYVNNKSLSHTMARKLVQSRANARQADALGKTVLHHAVLQNRSVILKLILDTVQAKYINEPDVDGNTPLHLAVEAQQLHLIRALVEHMDLYHVKSEYKNNDGFTPLTLACKVGRVDIARYLSKVAHHSPMRTDRKTLRNGRQWLETILFIPSELDPFNCLESDLLFVRPKPLEYVDKDCKRLVINYDWHKNVCPNAADKLSRRPHSAPGASNQPHHCMSTFERPTTIRANPLSAATGPASTSHGSIKFWAHSVTSPLSKREKCKGGVVSRTAPTCMELLPQFLGLKATSAGIRPSAQPLPDEEKMFSSEYDGTEACELLESQTNFKCDFLNLSFPVPRQKRFSIREKSSKQRVSLVQDVLATSATWSKMSFKKRKSIMNG